MKRERIDLTNVTVQHTVVGLGIGLYVVFHESYPCPLAFAWGTGYETENGSRFDTLGRYTPAPFKRNGLQARINEELFKHYDVITTCAATEEGSKFLKREGYKYDKRIRLWFKENKNGRQ